MNVANWERTHAIRFGGEIALIEEARVWTNRQLWQDATRVAEVLVRLNMRPGDRVVVALPNSRELFAVCSGVICAGGVLVLAPASSSAEIDNVVNHCSPFAAISNIHLGSAALRSVSKAVTLQITDNPAPEGSISLDGWIDGIAGLEVPVPRQASDPMQLCYTGGSTGTLKSVIYTHQSTDAYYQSRLPMPEELSVEILAVPPQAFGGRLLGSRPVKHATYVVFSRFDAEGILRAMEKYRVRSIALLPTMAHQIVAVASRLSFDLASLQTMNLGGSPVARSLVGRIRNTLSSSPNLKIVIQYGLTEAGGGVTRIDAAKEGVVGMPLPNVQIRILDPAGKGLPDGDVGEVVAKTPYAASGYWNDEVATASVFKDGWVHTGDLGYFTTEGQICLVGRQKQIIIQGGLNIYPQEIESALMGKLDGVRNCAAVGLPDELLGEIVVLAVESDGRTGITEEAVRSHCRRHLDARKQPTFIFIVDRLPLAPSGKVNLMSLREVVSDLINAAGSKLRAFLDGATPSHRQLVIRKLILNGVRSVSRLSLADSIDSDAPVGELGLDSIAAVRLARVLGNRFGIDVPSTLMYSHPTVTQMCAWVNSRLYENPNERHVHTKEPPDLEALEDIAVVGVGCRLPRDVHGPKAFWRLLESGEPAVKECPAWRKPSGVRSWRAAFVEDIDQFDAKFFRLEAEASLIDPQHRILLEVTWEAFEDAGICPYEKGESTGVFLGIYGNRYQGPDPLGSSPGMAAGRICHFFDFHGPVVSIDTTCSSSLVAVHNARTSLRQKECDIAVVGGVNLLAARSSFDPLGVVSKGGLSRAFDARADGFGQGEGCVVVILKRLGDALQCGDRVYSVIRGSAINHDGRSSSLTAPNSAAQAAVIREAQRAARVAPSDVQYVEAHGTGTQLGDPIEVQGLSEVFSSRPTRALTIGSVKTNIGHLEAGAGIAGLLKVVLAIHHKMLPASLNFSSPTPHVPWESIPIRVQTTLAAWPTPGAPLVAGVSSFGMSGTNAHIVLAEGPREEAYDPLSIEEDGRKTWLLPISAATSEALGELAALYATELGIQIADHCCDIAYSASRRRTHLKCRLAVVGRSPAEWAAALREFVADNNRGIKGVVQEPQPQLALLLGSYAPGGNAVDRGLLNDEPVVNDVLERCAQSLVRLGLLLDSEVERLQSAEKGLRSLASDPMFFFAIQVACVELWRSWGTEPKATIGLGTGRIAAEYVSGALSLDEAVKLVQEWENSSEGGADGNLHEFSKSVRKLLAEGYSLFVEVGLSPEVKAQLTGKLPLFPTFASSLLPSLSPDGDSRRTMQGSLARLYVNGFPVNWEKICEGSGRLSLLPSYPWQHHRFWHGDARSPFYSIAWKPLSVPSATRHSGSWLVFEDSQNVGAGLAKSEAARKIDLVLARCWRSAGREGYELDIRSTASFREVLVEILRRHRPTNIVYIWNEWRDDTDSGDAAENLRKNFERNLLAVALLVKAICELEDVPRLFLITLGCQPVRNSISNVTSGALWGFGATLMKEHPGLSTTIIDFEPGSSDIDVLWYALRSDDPENRQAIRAKQRFVPRLQRHVPRAEESAAELNPNASYIITGGWGQLGLIVAERLLELGARHLILVGRRPPDTQAEREIMRLESLGGTILRRTVDVADTGAVRKLLLEIETDSPPLRGVVHCAGSFSRTPVTAIDADVLRSGAGGKVYGAWNFHVLSPKLDFFIMFSSFAGLVGYEKYATYAAANSFLDTLAHFRRGRGLASQSLDWGGWARADQESIDSSLHGALAANEGAKMLELAMRDRFPQLVAVAPGPRGEFAPRRDSPASGLFVEVSPDAPKLMPAAPVQVATLSPTADISTLLVQEIGRIIGKNPAEVPFELTLENLGVDSLSAIRLQERVREETQTNLSIEVDQTVIEIIDAVNASRSEAGPAKSRKHVLSLRTEGESPRFVWLHPIVGGVDCYRPLVGELGHRAIAIAHRDPGAAVEQLSSIPAIAKSCLEKVVPYSSQPFILSGWSFGGIVAFEMAIQLRARGVHVPLVVLIDSYLVDPKRPRQVGGLSLMEQFAAAVPELEGALRSERDARFSTKIWEQYLAFFKSNSEALFSYRPEKYEGRTLLLVANESKVGNHQVWLNVATSLKLEVFPGDHEAIMQQSRVSEVASIIRRHLAAGA